MLAIGLLVMILLTLIGVTMSALRSSEKAALLGPATQVSESIMNRNLYQVANDLPAGTKASFWAASGPAPFHRPASSVDRGGAPGDPGGGSSLLVSRFTRTAPFSVYLRN